ncbi:S2/P23 family protein (plasmid) [Borrelia coriaceae]|uniref:p23-like cell envelope protein n=1 Tax=Borrelia coriaceae ATCC 43381 TaxID=1408429 RepID=W5T1I6_9SPIR|nr:S2/P23 family protein [Borrelia coriaceae]AHH11121.1 P23-like cell envelope protein [Borrelia coriaceae ATCC 43381]UPA17002.1 S2/P23 family protein [Borrelia coriaceae]
MKRIIILLPIFITCHIEHAPKYPSLRRSSRIINKHHTNTNENTQSQQEEPLKISEGILKVCLNHYWDWASDTCTITWAKSNSQEIIGEDTNPSRELQGKLEYSYAVAPIKNNANYSKYVMPLILFASKVEYIKVISFKLKEYPQLNLDFRKGFMQFLRDRVANKVEQSAQKMGYKYVYLCGILYPSQPNGGAEIISAFADLYQNGNWYFMEGEITIEDSLDRTKKTYTILLDSKLFNDFLKQIIKKHPDTTKKNAGFRIPVN